MRRRKIELEVQEMGIEEYMEIENHLEFNNFRETQREKD